MSDKYAFIDAEYADSDDNSVPAPTVYRMCHLLEVSKSGFYEWRKRPTSPSQARRDELKMMIKALFDASDGTYGYRRVHQELLRGGEQVGDELVRKLMQDMGLAGCQPHLRHNTTVRGQPAADDLVRRDFTAPTPGTKLVSDITYIPTWQGWLYLATVLDCFNKEVIGYAMADHMRTSLVTDAIDMAARNHPLLPDCIFHSDHGTQYTSEQLAAKLAELNMRQSLGRTGICYDNAMAESFFGMLKVERVNRTIYPTRIRAREDVARYIELFYNSRRLHSALDYRPPQEVRIEYTQRQVAA